MPITTINAVDALFNLRSTSAINAARQSNTTNALFESTRNGVVLRNQQTVSEQRQSANLAQQQQRAAYAGGLQKERRGFVLTSDLWKKQGKALALHAGPSEVSWTMPLRASAEDIKSGRAHYTQARKVDSAQSTTYFDLPTVQFTFQTGNILPIPNEGQQVIMPYGLGDFYYFMELVNQPPLIPDGDDEGSTNYLWVFYTSLQFPQMVIKGYIEPEGVSWNDSAESPNGFTWAASMAVYDSTPELWSQTSLADAYNNFDFTLF